MTEQIREQISAVMDGEMDSKSCSASIKSEEFTHTWFRYHLISDCMHDRINTHHHFDLTRKISESIQAEPTILAPSANSTPKYIKPLAGMAVAASVAAMAIIGFQQLQAPQDTRSTPSLPVAQVQTPPPQVEYGVPVVLPDAGAARPVQVQMQSDMRINRYLINHNEYRTTMGVGGVSPHVRLIGTGSNE
ncbi:MAG: sigma-E factor negative regulatory protein [Gammaproteobacteria bacterium]|nr:sigma-E factor negative regulatory protein [Gammaproteobacteria bacterium]